MINVELPKTTAGFLNWVSYALGQLLRVLFTGAPF